MDGAHPKYHDEMDLIEIFQTIWDGKWKIIGASLASLLTVLAAQFFLSPPKFTATTHISKIPSLEAERYAQFNSLGFIDTTPALMFDLYLEQLKKGGIFEQAMHDTNFLDAGTFSSEQEYIKALRALASSVEVVPMAEVQTRETVIDGQRVINEWKIKFQHADEETWKQVLNTADRLANDAVRHALRMKFDTAYSVAKQTQNFALEDITIQIERAKSAFDKDMEEFEARHRFELEDVISQIENAISDYDKAVLNRLAILNEQAKIARAIGVARGTIEAQTIQLQTGFLTNVTSDAPFYLMGYEAIEKEMELIKSREDKYAFVDGLFELEQKKRALEQDKTLQRADINKLFLDSLRDLENRKHTIEAGLEMKRAEELFLGTPIYSADLFKAVFINIGATDFEYNQNRPLALIPGMLFGAALGIAYVLLSRAMTRTQTMANQREPVFTR